MGGVFPAKQIPSEQPFEFKAVVSNCSVPNYFTNLENLLIQVRPPEIKKGVDPRVIGKYFIPFSRNYEGIDLLLLSGPETLLLFQITTAGQHAIKPCAIKQLLKILPKTIKMVYIIFVVPQDREKDYARERGISEAEEISLQRQKPLEIKQF